MRKIILLLICSTFALSLGAQNFQTHYDFDKDRQYFTSTIEMFRPDTFGSTFFFVDFDFNSFGNNTMSLSYFEIARYVTLPLLNNKLDVTVQFNDGHFLDNSGSGYPLGQVWLAGFSYPIDLKVIELKVDLLYRRADYSESTDWQFTAAWYRPFLNDKFVCSGFLDVWSETRDEKQIVIQSEPQLWFNAWSNLFVGGELEISYNFIPGREGLQVLPTAGLMWDFR